MNANHIFELKNLIYARIILLEDLAKGRCSPSKGKHDQANDPDASLDLLASSPVDTAVIIGAREETNQLKQSLVWPDSEEAGFCERCGSDIPIPRLKAVPESRLCVTCAETK